MSPELMFCGICGSGVEVVVVIIPRDDCEKAERTDQTHIEEISIGEYLWSYVKEVLIKDREMIIKKGELYHLYLWK